MITSPVTGIHYSYSNSFHKQSNFLQYLLFYLPTTDLKTSYETGHYVSKPQTDVPWQLECCTLPQNLNLPHTSSFEEVPVLSTCDWSTSGSKPAVYGSRIRTRKYSHLQGKIIVFSMRQTNCLISIII